MNIKGYYARPYGSHTIIFERIVKHITKDHIEEACLQANP